MTRPDTNMATTRQDFLKESYRKEGVLRNKWFQAYFGSNKLPPGVGGPDSSTSPIPASAAAKVTRIKIKPAPATPPKAKRPSPTFVVPTPDGKVKLTEMRAPSPETNAMIFSGLSAEGEGRTAYLHKRKIKGPEQKFEYPLLSSQEVGWDIQEVAKHCETKQGNFGKSRIIRDTFFAENGVM